MAKTARLDEMEHSGEHVPTQVRPNKPVGVCGKCGAKLGFCYPGITQKNETDSTAQNDSHKWKGMPFIKTFILGAHDRVKHLQL